MWIGPNNFHDRCLIVRAFLEFLPLFFFSTLKIYGPSHRGVCRLSARSNLTLHRNTTQKLHHHNEKKINKKLGLMYSRYIPVSPSWELDRIISRLVSLPNFYTNIHFFSLLPRPRQLIFILWEQYKKLGLGKKNEMLFSLLLSRHFESGKFENPNEIRYENHWHSDRKVNILMESTHDDLKD